MKNCLKQNYIFFQNQLPTLLKDQNKKNKFALIKDQQIIGVYDTVEQAIDTAVKEKDLN